MLKSTTEREQKKQKMKFLFKIAQKKHNLSYF